jgi:hypothetical protein
MDFVKGLPTSGSANAILVVVDKFSKFAHFIALKHPFTAKTMAQLFLDNIYHLHGLPKSIIYDRDKIFTSLFWQALLKQQALLSASALRITRILTDKLNR